MIKLTNDYHNSEASIRAHAGDTLSAAQVKRAQDTLCGIEGCTCGDGLGRRGRQPDNGGLTITQGDYDRWDVIAL